LAVTACLRAGELTAAAVNWTQVIYIGSRFVNLRGHGNANGGSMSSAAGGAPSSFSDRVLRFLERVEHRIAKTDDEREAAFRLRYDAYARIAWIEPQSERRLFDARYDTADNAFITLTFVDGELAATTRLNLGIGEDSILPSMAVYPDVIGPRLSAGSVILETTRLAADIRISGSNPELAYVAMRPGYMGGAHFDVDFGVATTRREHMPFYQRVFQFVPWCEPRPYPGLTTDIGCMGMDFREVRARVEERYPFFKSDPAQRELLFGPRGAGPNTGRSEVLGARLVSPA
jgi:N-acyl amino acid synthase FeeM